MYEGQQLGFVGPGPLGPGPLKDRRWDEYRKVEDRSDGKADEMETLRYAQNIFAISSCTVQVGDEVVLIGGVRTPLVIRSNPASTRLVGPAYLPHAPSIPGYGPRSTYWDQDWQADDLDEFFLS